MGLKLCIDARVIRSWRSGVGRMAHSLGRELPLAAPWLEATVLVHSRAEAVPADLESSVKIERLPIDAASIAQHARLPGWMRSQGFDVAFHLHPYSAPLVSRVRTVVGILDVYPLREPAGFPVGAALYYRCVIAGVARRAERVLTISEASRLDIARLLGVRADRIAVVPLAPDPVFRPIPAGPYRMQVLARLGVQEPFVLYHGNQRPHKNIGRMVEAFALARQRGVPHRLVVTGEHETGSRERDFGVLRAAAARGGVSELVDYTGYVSDEELAVLYSAASAVFLPSLMEGFGLPVVEAFACGAPVICSAAGALAEVAADAALLIDPLDVPAMADALALVLLDRSRAAALARAGISRAGRYSWRATAVRFAEVMAQALALPHARA